MSDKITFKSIVTLALPVSFGQLGHVLTNVSDNAMLGRFDPQHLAGATFGFNVFIPLMLFCIGLTMGLTPLVSERWSRHQNKEITKVFYSSGVLYYAVMGLFVITLYNLTWVMDYLGQTEVVATFGKSYVKVLIISLIPVMLFQHIRQFLEGLSNTKGAMYISLFGNLLNIFLNYIFIFGHFGFPAYGIMGAAYATLIARVAMAMGLLIYVLAFPSYRSLITPRRGIIKWGYVINTFNISFPIAVQLLMEVGAFAFMAIVVGWIGEKDLAGHQIALSVASISYILVSGLGASGTILVSKYLSLDNYSAIHEVYKKSLMLAVSFMAMCGIGFIIFRYSIAHLFLSPDEKGLIELVAVLFVYAALFQISDGIQATLIGLLRGFKDVLIPTLISIGAYWVVTLPLGYYLGIRAGLGAKGCWLAFVVGLSISSALLFWRIKVKMKPTSISDSKQVNIIGN